MKKLLFLFLILPFSVLAEQVTFSLKIATELGALAGVKVEVYEEKDLAATLLSDAEGLVKVHLNVFPGTEISLVIKQPLYKRYVLDLTELDKNVEFNLSLESQTQEEKNKIAEAEQALTELNEGHATVFLKYDADENTMTPISEDSFKSGRKFSLVPIVVFAAPKVPNPNANSKAITEADMKQAKANAKSTSKAAEKAEDRATAAEKDAEKAEKKLESQEKQMEKTEKKMEAQEKDLEKQEKQLEQQQEAQEKAAKAQAKQAKESANWEQKMAGFNKKQAKYNKQRSKLDKKQRKLDKKVKKGKVSPDDRQDAQAKINSEKEKLNKQIQKLEKKIKKHQKKRPK